MINICKYNKKTNTKKKKEKKIINFNKSENILWSINFKKFSFTLLYVGHMYNTCKESSGKHKSRLQHKSAWELNQGAEYV